MPARCSAMAVTGPQMPAPMIKALVIAATPTRCREIYFTPRRGDNPARATPDFFSAAISVKAGFDLALLGSGDAAAVERISLPRIGAQRCIEVGDCFRELAQLQVGQRAAVERAEVVWFQVERLVAVGHRLRQVAAGQSPAPA